MLKNVNVLIRPLQVIKIKIILHVWFLWLQLEPLTCSITLSPAVNTWRANLKHLFPISLPISHWQKMVLINFCFENLWICAFAGFCFTALSVIQCVVLHCSISAPVWLSDWKQSVYTGGGSCHVWGVSYVSVILKCVPSLISTSVGEWFSYLDRWGNSL